MAEMLEQTQVVVAAAHMAKQVTAAVALLLLNTKKRT
jgi:hypothetical protein